MSPEFAVNFLNIIRDESSKTQGLKLGEPLEVIQNVLFRLEGDSAKCSLVCELHLEGVSAKLVVAVSPKGDAALRSMLMQGQTSHSDFAKHAKAASENWNLSWDLPTGTWKGGSKTYTNAELASEICGSM